MATPRQPSEPLIAFLHALARRMPITELLEMMENLQGETVNSALRPLLEKMALGLVPSQRK